MGVRKQKNRLILFTSLRFAYLFNASTLRMLFAQCAVCHELFSGSVGCVMSALPCGHVFHKVCVDTWFRSSSTCPQCRIQVKSTKGITRLFFDILPSASKSSHSEANVPVESFIPIKDDHSNQQLRLELHRLQSEITRLEELLKQAERKTEENSKILLDREREVLSITTLYTESEKLYEKERQRCRELRMELASLKQFLREAEAMKATATQLRAEMEDMENVKKLIASSEEPARELLSRYTTTKESTSHDLTCDLTSVCRWAAVLRTELTSAREKVRNYRIELSRVRKLHQTASQRAARAEKRAAQKEADVHQLENLLSTLTKPSNALTDPRADLSEADEVATQVSTLLSPSCEESSTRHSPSTPDLLASTSTNPSTVELQKRLRTPLDNPFRAITDNEKSLHLRVSKVQSFECPLFSTPLSKSAKNSGIEPPSVQRRPSVLYEMAIMRRHVLSSTAPGFPRGYPAPTSTHASSIARGETDCSRKPLSKRPIANPKRHKLHMNKLLRLDSFLSKF
ncbi:unnamed protein product [Dicrocoelium dendriticum]|nr:unnamed protein product [Dicrocoelium dendriticum]